MPRVAPSRRSGAEKLRSHLLAIGLRLAIALCRILPREPVVRFGGWLSERIYPYDHQRRRRALKNLKRVFPERGLRGREKMARAMYRHFGMVGAEYLLLLARQDMRPYSQWLEIENTEAAREAIKRYGSAIFVTCHGGHFELLGAAASEQIAPLNAVMKPIANPELNELFVALREKLGMGLIQKFPALRTIVAEIRAGNCVAMLVDQRRRNRALIVEFFGRPAATVDTPAVLAYRYGIPIIPGFSYREGGPLAYRGYVDDPILPDPNAPRDQEVVRLTQAVNDAIERFVRAHPLQWNWTQPRWRISARMRRRARRRPGAEPDPVAARASAAPGSRAAG